MTPWSYSRRLEKQTYVVQYTYRYYLFSNDNWHHERKTLSTYKKVTCSLISALKMIAYSNYFLRRNSKNIFLICYIEDYPRAQSKVNAEHVISFAVLARKYMCTCAFYIDKKKKKRKKERRRRRGFFFAVDSGTAGCLSSAAGCAHLGSGRVYQHRVFNVMAFQLGLVSPSRRIRRLLLEWQRFIPLSYTCSLRSSLSVTGDVNAPGRMHVQYVTSISRHTWETDAGCRRWISRA